jgi:hypothetical protein
MTDTQFDLFGANDSQARFYPTPPPTGSKRAPKRGLTALWFADGA